MEKYNKTGLLAKLFATFFKIGLFTFGGGYAMLGLIERETTAKGWATEQDIVTMVALSESTPGPIAVNSATFIGNRKAGFLGAFVATLGVVLPSYIVISTLFFILNSFLSNVYVSAAFMGIRACVPVLILNALIKLFRTAENNVLQVIITVGAFALATFTKISEVYLLLACGVVGIAVALIGEYLVKKSGTRDTQTSSISAIDTKITDSKDSQGIDTPNQDDKSNECDRTEGE